MSGTYFDINVAFICVVSLTIAFSGKLYKTSSVIRSQSGEFLRFSNFGAVLLEL